MFMSAIFKPRKTPKHLIIPSPREPGRKKRLLLPLLLCLLFLLMLAAAWQQFA